VQSSTAAGRERERERERERAISVFNTYKPINNVKEHWDRGICSRWGPIVVEQLK